MAKKAGAAKGAEAVQKKLALETGNCWDEAGDGELKDCGKFAGEYKDFLDKGKTEREFVRLCVKELKAAGFTAFDGADAGKRLAAGDKVFLCARDKCLLAAVIGKAPPLEGINILGAHADSPRIDLKTNPLYEDSGLALLDTHYYGGIKHYQWTAIPLAMHGVVIGADGKRRDICVGEDEGDPVFTITDLLPHLARDQMAKKASEFIDGEGLDILAGSRPYGKGDSKVKDRVKLLCLSLLNDKYGVTEEDFASGELEFVPAFKARDLGLDRSMVAAYGQDDRSCAFAAFRALVDEAARAKSAPAKTALCYLSDKEEIGSMGNTGAQSRAFENFIAALCAAASRQYSERELRQCLNRSSMLSADVNAAFDPSHSDVFDKKTSSYLGRGLALSKFTGRGGKYGGSEANAEFYRRVQLLLTKNKVRWQFGELGKVDKGGGGTIAQHAANLGIEVLDCGIPVLSMHSPYEVISKIDLYTAYRGYRAFLKDA
ncbi:MAG: probable M18 family aminopeptidase 1 [Treponematales bacterium]